MVAWEAWVPEIRNARLDRSNDPEADHCNGYMNCNTLKRAAAAGGRIICLILAQGANAS
jgi:hypothetical protein